MAIFRRFDTCTIINLLSLQAELLAIQQDFQDACHKCDMSPAGEEKWLTSDFYELMDSSSDNGVVLRKSLEALRQKSADYSM